MQQGNFTDLTIAEKSREGPLKSPRDRNAAESAQEVVKTAQLPWSCSISMGLERTRLISVCSSYPGANDSRRNSMNGLTLFDLGRWLVDHSERKTLTLDLLATRFINDTHLAILFNANQPCLSAVLRDLAYVGEFLFEACISTPRADVALSVESVKGIGKTYLSSAAGAMRSASRRDSGVDCSLEDNVKRNDNLVDSSTTERTSTGEPSAVSRITADAIDIPTRSTGTSKSLWAESFNALGVESSLGHCHQRVKLVGSSSIQNKQHYLGREGVILGAQGSGWFKIRLDGGEEVSWRGKKNLEIVKSESVSRVILLGGSNTQSKQQHVGKKGVILEARKGGWFKIGLDEGGEIFWQGKRNMEPVN
ncbi:hypothetical protein BC832DRAFT_321050 [Gaertneriomyces semiglobifer]|nr:hypothetical protein BC832DRAFT_321050 [Gaertneriomyces semiglobifer]